MESRELLTFRSLNTRSTLLPNEKKHYFRLEKGFQGEVMFDQIAATLQNNVYIVNNLWLEYNNSVFQIDSLLISQETIYPFEIKNFEGDYYYDSDGFYSMFSKEEIMNPLAQLKRSKSLLCPLLKKLGIYLPVEGFVTFVNPEFTLYQAPLSAPIIYPTQLKNFMKKIDQTPSKLNERHKKLANQLMEMDLIESPYAWKPKYSYGTLKKGIICSRCFSFMNFVGDKKLVCSKCACEEKVDSAVLRSVKELQFLFPDMRITTNGVHDWCGGIGSKKVVRRILLQNLTSIGTRQHRYFE
ncbi:nuclease-related domain-containing protein [Neobacillus sp. OS1-2]|uniref:nuclease-related domain-containing protein n=1 Tax=Neobacillus sp. OS1-2 TaxID=3070680 RepID=UPI0027DEE81A|nr:nuclease-related domain-containing protein [Neobacillus sp. OS1-2]WML42224.1 nuclease-related domain-containing protein [Neobacillus sp. OS1-2]